MGLGEASRRATADLWLGMSVKNLCLVLVRYCLSTLDMEHANSSTAYSTELCVHFGRLDFQEDCRRTSAYMTSRSCITPA